MNIIRINSCASTNSSLKELLRESQKEEGTVIVAKEQIAGRGQAGNHWESEAGKNLTFSILFRPCFLPVKNYFLLSKVVAIGIQKMLSAYAEDIYIKWPNDIFYRNKKLAGILIENEIMGQKIIQSIAGAGININQEEFHSNAPNPVSLKQITGANYDLDILLKQLLASISSYYELLIKGESEFIEQAYHKALYRGEGYFPYKDKEGVFHARIESVANDGIIYLTDDKGLEHSYSFKEVSFII
jgi:BirA family biotin operon repressor/biotin-[acetyl-CoA-carboxylase] ligase